MNSLVLENNYVEDWTALVVAAFLLLGLGIFLGMFVEKSLKNLSVMNHHHIQPQTVSYRPPPKKTEADSCFKEELLPPIDRKLVPKHIAVIMDGNRRFGKLTHSDPLQGHWAGGQTLIDFVQWCIQDGIGMATVYAFSTENWNRDPIEVTTLMTIFAKYAETFVAEALAHDVCVNVLSTGRVESFLNPGFNPLVDYDKLPPKVQASVTDLIVKTRHCKTFTLNICLSYGGRRDIVCACQSIASKVIQNEVTLPEIDEALVNHALITGGLPDPELLIRTSGEFRLSNFLLWQTAYSELFFIDKFWPQFSQRDFRKILHEYLLRGRRFGK